MGNYFARFLGTSFLGSSFRKNFRKPVEFLQKRYGEVNRSQVVVGPHPRGGVYQPFPARSLFPAPDPAIAVLAALEFFSCLEPPPLGVYLVGFW